MNPEERLTLISSLLIQAQKGTIHNCHLCFFHGEFFVGPNTHTTDTHPILWQFNNHQMRYGLTASEWLEMSKRIGAFFERKNL